MSASSISYRLFAAGVALIVVLGSAGLAEAEAAPDSENGRYSFSPTADGVLRLDTRTGSVSTCTGKASGWACYAVPDERAAFDIEIGRLQADNLRLKAELAKRDLAEPGSKTDAPLAKEDSEKRSAAREKGNRLELQLPDDRDVERVVSFLERAWRRLVEMATRMQKDVSGRI